MEYRGLRRNGEVETRKREMVRGYVHICRVQSLHMAAKLEVGYGFRVWLRLEPGRPKPAGRQIGWSGSGLVHFKTKPNRKSFFLLLNLLFSLIASIFLILIFILNFNLF